MKIRLENDLSLKGMDMTMSWKVTVVNDEGLAVVTKASITSQGALREAKQELQRAIAAVEELMPKANSR